MMTQTWALFVDAYRELNAKKLFWITLILSVLVVIVFAMLGINQKGITFLHWEIEAPINTNVIPQDKFYKFLFANFAISVWLTWIATILALISTAGVIPDLVSGGSIELALSKPLSRARLFLTKYATGLLFVGLQVLVFTLGWIILIGVRGGSWDPMLLHSITIVVVFFSYLFCFCALIGLLTKSTITSLLLTLLFWLFLFGLNTTDGIFLVQREASILNLERLEQRIVAQERWAGEQIENGAVTHDAEGNLLNAATDELAAVNPMLARSREQVPELEQKVKTWRLWSGIITGVRTVMPKTNETVALLDRYLLTAEEKRIFRGEDPDAPKDDTVSMFQPDPELNERLEQAIRERSVLWILGGSLLFEGAVLGLCCLIFARRDF